MQWHWIREINTDAKIKLVRSILQAEPIGMCVGGREEEEKE